MSDNVLLERYLNDHDLSGICPEQARYAATGHAAKVVDLDDEKSEEPVVLPEYACAYCGIHEPTSVVKCETCQKWFCNSKTSKSGSHIISHLVLSKHHSVSLHEDSELGETPLECYSCGNSNLFALGFVPAKAESVVVILCRLPCAQVKDVRWDTSSWQSLIEDRQLLSWVASVPWQDDDHNSRAITPAQIAKLEAKWKSDRAATLADINEDEDEDEIVPILMRYEDAYQYQRSFAPLVKKEADQDKQMVESLGLEHLSVTWEMGLNKRHLASFALSTFDSSDLKVAIGDEVVLKYTGSEMEYWECAGFIVKIPSSVSETFTMELMRNKQKPPTHLETGFSAKFVWKGIPFDRMQEALKSFAVDGESLSTYLYHKLLGHDVVPVVFDVELPHKFSIPGIADLNLSQVNAVRNVLERPLSLIQGPPGTGKTVTSATIIYHLSKINKEQILVCAPSNIAVDHLTEKISLLGLNVIRLAAKAREDAESDVDHLTLHELVRKQAKGDLKKLIALKSEIGELSHNDQQKYRALSRKAELKLLRKADVICTTCVGAGAKILDGFRFKTVLIDESTQASEPEILIPIVKGAKQVVLVGDHQQLGPVIVDKQAGEAGLHQSLFERLIFLGQVPIRLEVQYRMHPALSEFSSNVFYDGSLQNGLIAEERTLPNSTFNWPSPRTPMMFWANFGKEEISGTGTSYLNRIEAMNCEKIVTKLFRDGVKPSQIGIITPYEGQRAYVVQYMMMNGALENRENYREVEVASVDAFQGREKDFIILSCVRANEERAIGFLSDPRRLNVALTRAKFGLVVLGNPRSLSKNRLWNQLLVHFREKLSLVEGNLDNLQPCPIKLGNSSMMNSKTRWRPKNTAVSTNDDASETGSLASFVADGLSANRNGDQNNWTPLFKPTSEQWPSLSQAVGGEGISALTDSFSNGLQF
ncbi:unnamed protein product [Kuraishia capsulata CBS 1993]|uniref:Upf1 domain-containing protein n=1 Tax=Kuraishia capsulata CBS 1993 TaxID=1382522 RepID=W6MY34_9ASCO|nr:uncharacterized protein KUCA_T00005934001 [Kuraishia capsulata CBS 1993]CDK29940.1 unnamed protein product [Kuraishia capsulata CBS 1993]